MGSPTPPARAARTRRGAAARAASGAPCAGDLLLDRYELRTELGRGSMGRVYRAHDRLLGRDVAIKVLAHAGDGGADAEFRRAVAREARAAARLAHPSIATLFDIGDLLRRARPRLPRADRQARRQPLADMGPDHQERVVRGRGCSPRGVVSGQWSVRLYC